MAGGTKGFTLIEVVAALAILGLLLAVILPRMPVRVSQPGVEGLALKISALLDRDRRAAMLRHRVVASTVDVAQRSVGSGSGGPALVIPNGIAVTSALARTCLGTPNGNRIVFLPSGMSCGGQVTLEGAGSTIDVTVDWLTGSSTIASR